jgi:hypothetical protein
MKRVINTMFAVLALAVCLIPVMAAANHDTIAVLSGKVPQYIGTCSFTEKGEMHKDGTIEKPCQVFVTPGTVPEEGAKFWAAIFNPEAGVFVEVIEATIGGTNVSVWKIEKLPFKGMSI